jgi:hypothetical protein
MSAERRQTPDVDAPAVLAGGAVIAMAIVLSVAIAWILVALFGGAQSSQAIAGHTGPASPHLETYPAQDYREFRAADDAKLDGYRWIDRERGIVHIPIAEAMSMLAAQHRQAPSASVPAANAAGSPR